MDCIKRLKILLSLKQQMKRTRLKMYQRYAALSMAGQDPFTDWSTMQLYKRLSYSVGEFNTRKFWFMKSEEYK